MSVKGYTFTVDIYYTCPLNIIKEIEKTGRSNSGVKAE